MRISNRLPRAVQIGGLTRINIRDERGNLCRGSAGAERFKESECQAADPIIHDRHLCADMQVSQNRNAILNVKASETEL
jgi:hypothetical protein